MSTESINVSGITVVVRPESFDAARRRIAELPGIEITAEDAARGRLVVVQDLPDMDDHRDGLRRLQALPEVLLAELVCHYCEDGPPDTRT